MGATSSIFRSHSSKVQNVEFDHLVSGWDKDEVEKFKNSEKFCVSTFNKISVVGLSEFPKDLYDTVPNDEAEGRPAHALMLRSHKLKEEEILPSVRAIARCGAGTNNIPVPRMTELGIPVFNTPGANANAVKELVLCGLLLGSRRIVDGINHMKDLGSQGLARERVEKDKALFGGREIKGKTLAVIGLGHIGASTARDAKTLGMKLVGYDPGLSVQSAMKVPRDMKLADSISSAVANADYISLNIPYTKASPDEGGTHGIIGQAIINHCKPDAVILDFARGELVDSVAIKDFLDKSDEARYISDFPDDELWDHPNSIIVPHLGASTGEAEDSAAVSSSPPPSFDHFSSLCFYIFVVHTRTIFGIVILMLLFSVSYSHIRALYNLLYLTIIISLWPLKLFDCTLKMGLFVILLIFPMLPSQKEILIISELQLSTKINQVC